MGGVPMKGRRDKYNDLGENESLFSFYKRHTTNEEYGTYKTAYNHLKKFCQKERIKITSISDPEAEKFCWYLKQDICRSDRSGLKEETAEAYVMHLSWMFGWIVENTDYLDWQPFDDVPKEEIFEYDQRESKKRDIPLDDLRQHVRNITSPNLFVLTTIMLKAGLRIGEVADLTYRDINLDHPVAEYMPEVREEIRSLPDTLYIDSSKKNSKEKSYREIPIDQELKSVLIWYIKMSPPTKESPHPLIIDLNSCNGNYTRLGTVRLWEYFSEWSKNEGLWIKAQNSKNIHPHWCRHWFTTVLRANISDEDVLIGNTKDYVKGLRGDSGGDVIDTYSHEWESLRDETDPSWREVYENAMPLLLIKPDDTEVNQQENWNGLENKVPDFAIPN